MTHISTSTQSLPVVSDNHGRSPLSASSGSTARTFPFPAAGPLVIPMTNDYLFRALLQRNNSVLKGLICSLLHLMPDEIHSVEITNPIELGASITDKTFILDIKVILNSLAIINLELQVINQYNWVERSLSYLCRNFDNLQAGEEYQNVRPVIQIGLLNFTLFPKYPEFYATYKLLNVKNHSLYSDKLQLSVLDLTHINLANEEDKSYQLDSWASLFKSTTWEELNMLAQNNKFIEEASATVYQLSQEERIRMECEAREDYYRTQLGVQHTMDKQISQLASQSVQIEMQAAQIEAQNAQLQAQNAQLQTQDAQLQAQDAQLQAQDAQLQAQDAQLQAQGAQLETQAAQINKLYGWMREHGYDPENI